MTNIPLLKVKRLKKYFPLGKGFLNRKTDRVHAVDGVSFTVNRGETLGLVGESGSGKTTVGRCVLRLLEPTSGSVVFDGVETMTLPPAKMKTMRRDMQIIFQDPYGSLSPRLRLRSILKEPLNVHGVGSNIEKEAVVVSMLERVGLRPEHLDRYPHEFSGGQRQRIAIARTLMLNPRLIIADEPVSALDVSIQAQILNMMATLQREMRLSYLFISHDLSVIKYMSDRIAVIYLGKIVEMVDRDELYLRPRHPYTRALLSAIPRFRPGGAVKKPYLSGETPSPINPPPGCAFHPRCENRVKDCDRVSPELRDVGKNHFVACHLT